MKDENYKVNFSSDPSYHPPYHLRLKSSQLKIQVEFKVKLLFRPSVVLHLKWQTHCLFQIQTVELVDDLAWNISGDVGLVSAGRINKDTPPLTTPSHTSKSSAMDTSSYIF